VSDISLSAVQRINALCDRFVEAWLAGRRPCVADFLREAPEEDRPQARDALLGEAAFRITADQRRRWGQGERVSAEEYLREEPALREGPERVLELVANEVALRRERGEAPRAEDYLALLPGREAELRRLFERQAVLPQAVDGPRARDTMRPGPGAGTLPADGRPGEPVPPELGRYRPRGFLGGGGMGEVFWVYDSHMRRDVALKVLRQKYRGQRQAARRFLKEVRTHGRLQHPGFAPVYDQGTAGDGRPYFTMKLVKGRTLAELLKERTDPAKNMLQFLKEVPRFLVVFEGVCQAVAYAHGEGVIHRDLKPANVMVGAFAEVQVMDLGLAKWLGPARDHEAAPAVRGPTAQAPGAAVSVNGETRPGQVLGTLAYMAPEQARGEAERVDRRADVFGLGAILCEVLTGQPPFGGEGWEEALARAQACDHAEAMARLEVCLQYAELGGVGRGGGAVQGLPGGGAVGPASRRG
jgi:tRNA A-37 threonylcarbamoyl transferase component Bud32